MRWTDEQITAAQAGDQQALADFYTAHHSQVVGFMVNRVRDRPEAENLAQDVWLRVVKGLHTVRPSNVHPVSWVLTIAHRRCIDYQRRRQYQRADYTDTIDGYDYPAQDCVEDDALRNLERDHVRRVVAATLTGRQLDIVTAQLAPHEPPGAVLAEERGLSVTTVNTAAFKARERLRPVLADWYGEPANA